ncbi:hypothetical protein AAFF_G00437970 [Aldrovandia affinis]|uniref:Uncharacterized protein n=1 Tax=Aldrovandia affinis TaxID=143900 RepID=A0AAD7SA08_9TELE|nr:hypothetical protein AAFF_G00437970 [Aldrovandia affinis]
MSRAGRQQQPLPLCAEVQYPEELKDARKQYRQTFMKERPETFIADKYQNGDLYSTVTEMKDNFTQLEIELVQLRELVLTQLCSKDSTQTLQDQISKLKKEHESTRTLLLKGLQRDREMYKGELTALTEEVRELQQDREMCRREQAAVTEELQKRDRTVQNMREQLHSPYSHSPHHTTVKNIVLGQDPVTPHRSNR